MEGLANQQDNMEIMDSSLYYKAARGEIDAFKQHPKPLNQLVTPIDKNTILHIHITSRCRFSSYPSYYYLHVKREVLSFDPSETSSVNFVKDVLRICPDLLNQPNAKDETLLHMAARHGHEDVVKIIAEENERILQEDQEAARLMLRMVNKVKDTALHEAVRYGHLDVVKELVKRDGEFSYGANDCGETPLYLAAEKGFSMAVDQILEACKSPAFQGPGERTALHAAVLCKDEEMTRKIVGKMRFLATKADKQGWVPLHYAAQSGCLPIVKILLEADTSAAYIANKTEEKTPLHLASQNGQRYTMEELISRCPGCWEQVDAKGRNVLHYAVASDNKFAVYTILDDTSLSNLINEKDRDGNTPLHQHVTSYNYLKYFIGHPKVDRHAFNNRNLNPLDVILSQDGLSGNQGHGETGFGDWRAIEASWSKGKAGLPSPFQGFEEPGRYSFPLIKSLLQRKVIELLLDNERLSSGLLDVNAVNRSNLSALDMLLLFPSEAGDREIMDILSGAGALRARDVNLSPMASLDSRTLSETNHLQPKELEYFKFKKGRDSPSEARGTLLIIAALVASATFQVAFNPPGGAWQDNYFPNQNDSHSATISKKHLAGWSILGTSSGVSFSFFAVVNSIGLSVSLYMIKVLTSKFPLEFELGLCMLAMFFSYNTAMIITSPEDVRVVVIISTVILTSITPLLSKWTQRLIGWII
ncbi:Ankyrin repeat - like 3 [Theobroma cacao]|nr:Ankyrin repeat - like 3 [Theobroma cacao]